MLNASIILTSSMPDNRKFVFTVMLHSNFKEFSELFVESSSGFSMHRRLWLSPGKACPDSRTYVFWKVMCISSSMEVDSPLPGKVPLSAEMS